MFVISSCEGRAFDVSKTLPSKSSVSVDSPHLIIKAYFFFLLWTKDITLVASPIATGRIPVAKGSSVPPWPTFLRFNVLEILVTICLDVTPACLSTMTQPLIFFFIIALAYVIIKI